MAALDVKSGLKKKEGSPTDGIINGESLRSRPSRSSTTPTPSSSKTKSETPTPAPANGSKADHKHIGHLPRAEEQALETFEVLKDNAYQYSTLGRSREVLEGMACDCQFLPGDDLDGACGSDCINRLTQVECLPSECRCRSYCRNQRMQRKEYANLEVVLTEKKGFGLRAGSNIQKDDLVYEYIGDVVNHTSLMKRMREYAQEGLRHFYFMMLQKDEFIDATRRGGIGRFANHSCNPNCYVAKWTVGTKVRMGIYAKRNIKKDEEVTFNYNVDRYGHEAQQCYCGEPNCVGVLGGKTQTEVSSMDDATLDALGISEELEAAGPAQAKKIKQRKIGDAKGTMQPMRLADVPAIWKTIRRTESREILLPIIHRMRISEDQNAMREFMRLRGFTLMANLIEDFINDSEICLAVIQALRKWPLLQRNKIEDSRIEKPVKKLLDSEDEKVRTAAEEILTHWQSFEVGYRIPKRLTKEGSSSLILKEEPSPEDLQAAKRMRKGDISDLVVSDESAIIPQIKPLGKYRASTVSLSTVIGEKPQTPYVKGRWTEDWENAARRYEIIASAARKAEEDQRLREETALAEREKAEKEAAERKGKSAERKAKKAGLTEEQRAQVRDTRLIKLIGAVVVKVMSRDKDEITIDTFKKHAKHLTQVIVEKEKKSRSYQAGRVPDALSPEKTNKIKAFTKEYMAKVLVRKKFKDQSKRGGPGSALHSKPDSTTEQEGANDDDNFIGLPDGEGLDLGDDDDNSGDPSPASDLHDLASPAPAVAVVGQDIDPDIEMADERVTRIVPVKIRRPTSLRQVTQ